MGTKSDLEDAILNYTTNDEDNFVANIPNFIRAGEDRVWFFVQVPKFRKSVTGLCTINEELLGLPSDFLAMAVLLVKVGDQYYPVDNKDETYLREVYPDPTATGRPKVYAQLDDDTIILAPAPDIAYPVRMTHFYKPASLADQADDGTTWLSTNCYETLKYATLIEAAIYMKNPTMKTEYEESFLTHLTGLKNLGEVRLRKDVNRGGEKRGIEQ